MKLIEFYPQNTIPITNIQIERFSINIEFFNSKLPLGMNKYEIQNTLLDSSVVVLGCGGLGSHIILELAAIGIGNLTIVDFDEIELSNLNRQIL
ncbi:ThiF family adenylyltransferase [Pantoea sp. Eser]|nr:ThiF family adenylyltransferase [Pantoea sp. Eser]